MNNIIEFFGLNEDAGQQAFKKAAGLQTCPFSGHPCIKNRKSDASIKIGTCVVVHKNEDIIICPNRFLQDKTVFKNCVKFLKNHVSSNRLSLIPEVKIKGGCVDFFLVSSSKEDIVDFAGIELQAVDTSGSLWPDRMALLRNGNDSSTFKEKNNKTFGINWKMTLKTILIQIYHKAKTFEELGKPLILIIQRPLYEHMEKDFNLHGINESKSNGLIHIHSYDLTRENNDLKLNLSAEINTCSTNMEKFLEINRSKKESMSEVVKALEQKMEKSISLNV